MFKFLKENLGLSKEYLRLLGNPLKEFSSIFIYPEREVKCTESILNFPISRVPECSPKSFHRNSKNFHEVKR
jgi:hypothetical protein